MMLRAIFCSVALITVLVPASRAADTKNDKDKGHKPIHATISKIDSQDHTLTVKTTDGNGKDQEKKLQLANDVKYLNASGKEAKADSFKAGDDVCVKEQDGKVTEIRKECQAKVTKVDRKAGTITVKMKDENGKDVEKTFRLVEESEYLDSTGQVALLDVFQSGDDILFVEADGHIKSMKKSNQPSTKTADKDSNKKTENKVRF